MESNFLKQGISDIVKGKKVRNRKAVNAIFRKPILSSDLNMREIHALITAFK